MTLISPPLRPNSDVKKAGVSFSSGTVLFSLVDDAPDDDATYGFGTAGLQYPNAYAHLGLTACPTVLATQRIKQVRIRGRVRMQSSVPGYGAHLNVRVWDPQSGLGFGKKPVEQPAGSPDDFFTSNASTVQAKTGPWHTAPPLNDGVEWTKPVLDRAVLHLAWYHTPTAGKINLRTTELYVDVDIRDQPAVTGTVVSGWDVSTRPTVTWNFVPNADGDPQNAYRVKIFSAAQFGIGGFNPETSPSTWDSGELSGGAETLPVGIDLTNGVTYRAYVKASQDFNGVRWFSAWASSSNFTITLTAPPIPTMVVTPDPVVPWLRNIIKITANVNLLNVADGTFEVDGVGVIDSYVPTNATLVASGTQFAHGAFSMRMTATAAANMEAATSGYPFKYRCKGSTSYTFLAQSRASTTSRSFRVRVRWYDKNGTIIGAVVNGSSVANSNANFLAQSTLTATSPANAMFMQVAIEVIAPAAGEIHYVDNVSASTSTSTTWTLPGLAPTGPAGAGSTVVEYSWCTIGEGNLASPQLWGAGDGFLRTADGFFPTGSFSTVEYDLSDRFHGQGSVRWDVRDTTSQLFIGWPTGVLVDPSPAFPLAAVPGRIYSFSLRARASASFSSQLNLQAIDKDGNSVGGSVNGGAVTITTSWQEFRVQNFTIPATAVWVRAFLSNSASVTEVAVWVDAVQWHLGATTPADREQPSGQPTVWTAVRGADEKELPVADEDGIAYVMDHEVPPGYTVTYRARTITEVSGQIIGSDNTPYVQTMLDPPGQGTWVLSSVALAPINRMAVCVTNIAEEQHEEVTQYFPQRPTTWQRFAQRPVVVSDYIGGFDGELKISVDNDNDFFLVRQLVHTPGTLWLIFPDHGARWIRVLDRQWSRKSLPPNECPPGAVPERRWLRELTLPFVEADRPT